MDRPITKCDICEKEFFQEDLVNIDPQVTGNIEDLQEGYEEFDGMVCEDCYNTICKPEYIIKKGE